MIAPMFALPSDMTNNKLAPDVWGGLIMIAAPVYIGLLLTIFTQTLLIYALRHIVVDEGDGQVDDVFIGNCSSDSGFLLRSVCLCILVAYVFESEVRECRS